MSTHSKNDSPDLPPLSLPHILIAESLAVLALAQPSRLIRCALFVPIAWCYLHTIIHTSTGIPAADLGVGNMLGVRLFFAFDFLVLSDAWNEIWRRDEGPGTVREMPGWKRVLWAVELWNSLRGVGWNFGLGARPTPHKWSWAPTRRLYYVLYQLARLVPLYLLHDAASFLMSLEPAFQRGGDVWVVPFWRRGVLLGAWAVAGGTALAMQQCFVGVLAVGLFGGRPENWPVGMYGDVWDAWSLRRFWGYVPVFLSLFSEDGKLIGYAESRSII